MKQLSYILRIIFLLMAALSLVVVCFAGSIDADPKAPAKDRVRQDSVVVWCAQCVERAIGKGADSISASFMCKSLYLDRYDFHYLDSADPGKGCQRAEKASEAPTPPVRYHRKKWTR